MITAPAAGDFTEATWAASVAAALNAQVGGVFVDAAARDAEVTDPSAGLFAYLTGTGALQLHDGGGWVTLAETSVTWVPSFGGLTVASRTATGTYRRVNGWCEFWAKCVLGATPSAITPLSLSLPIAGTSVERGQFHVTYSDADGVNYPGFNSSGSTTILLNALTATGTYVSTESGLITLTAPFTWAVDDYVFVSGRYRLANRYA